MIATLPAGATGFDTAANITPEICRQAKAAGDSFVNLYVPYGSTARTKFWTPAEIEYCFEVDLGIMAVFEMDAGRALAGGVTGFQDGRNARKSMRLLDFPDEQPIMCALDYDVWSRNSIISLAYVKGFAAGAEQVPCAYGDQDVADGLIGLNPVVCLPNAPAWSRTLAHLPRADRLKAASEIPGVKIFQLPSGPRYGINLDPLVVTAETTCWMRERPKPPPPVEDKPHSVPTPPVVVTTPPSSEEDDMLKYIAITAEGRNPALVAFGDAGTQMIGIPGPDTAAVLALYGVPTITTVSTELWDDFLKHTTG